MQKQNFTLSHSKKFTFRLLGVFLLSLALTACDPSIYSTDAPRPTSDTTRNTPAYLARRGNHEGAAVAYRRLAGQSSGVQRNKYYLEAADQWFRAKAYKESQRDLYNITGVLDSSAQVRKVLLQTRIELELDNPAQALRTIDTLNPAGAPDIARPYYALKALALFELGQLNQGTESFLMREKYLRSPRDLEDSRRRLWKGLIDASTQGFREEFTTDNTIINGWVSLAQEIANAYNTRGQGTALEAWREDYPTHPAYRIASTNLPTINQNNRNAGGSNVDFRQVQNVAVLIPLSGRLGPAGQVIQRGIEAANQNNGKLYTLSFHDTGSDVFTAYASAMRVQPDALIGPLDKNNIQSLSSRFGDIPVLALNRAFDSSLNSNISDMVYRSDESSRVPTQETTDSLSFSNLLQFGLAPEDEAQVAAQAALANGHTQIVTFTPANEWGDRVLTSFAQTFVAGGGRLLETTTYSTRENDHSNSIKAMLNLDESSNRHAQVAALFGEVEYEPRRRQDVDAIFIAAQPKQGRQIRPQLKFHYANRLPVYATSSIYSADATKNKDLDGITLPLSAWEVDPYTNQPELASRVDIFSPEQTPNTQILRLFGLGYDALNFVQHHSVNPEQPFAGLTGNLNVDEQGLIRRSLPIVVIRDGQPAQ